MDTHCLNRSGSPVLMALRACTADRHAFLDRSLALSHPHPTIAAYGDHLQRIHAWLGPLERSLQRFGDGPQNPAVLSVVNRAALIERDLSDMGIMAPDAAIAGSSSLTQQADPDYRWGACYVVEGMQLGGAVLHRRLAAPGGFHPARFLTGNGVPPGPRWHRFLQALGTHVQGEQAIARACAGAADAFDSLIALLPVRFATVPADACAARGDGRLAFIVPSVPGGRIQ